MVDGGGWAGTNKSTSKRRKDNKIKERRRVREGGG